MYVSCSVEKLHIHMHMTHYSCSTVWHECASECVCTCDCVLVDTPKIRALLTWCKHQHVCNLLRCTYNMYIIGERERANLVVQLARFFYIYIYPALMYAVMFYVILNKRKRLGDCVTYFVSIRSGTYRNVSKYALHEKNACAHSRCFTR